MVQAADRHSTRARRIQAQVPQILSNITDLNRAMDAAPDFRARRIFRRVAKAEQALATAEAGSLADIVSKLDYAMTLVDAGHCYSAIDILMSGLRDLRRLAGAQLRA